MIGTNITTDQGYGRVEIRPQGSNHEFGTICDDMWDNTDARVVCRSLGFSDSELNQSIAIKSAYFGEGSGPIYLGNLHCGGKETSLIDCQSSGWGSAHCFHHQDASVSCGIPVYSTNTPSPNSTTATTSPQRNASNIVEGTARLINGSNCLNGQVELFYEGEWKALCYSYGYAEEANVLCRSMGFRNGARHYTYGNPSVPVHTLQFYCFGSQENILNCSYYTSTCYRQTLNVTCYGDEKIDCNNTAGLPSLNCTFVNHTCGYKANVSSGHTKWKWSYTYKSLYEEPERYMQFLNSSARESDSSTLASSATISGNGNHFKVEFLYKLLESSYHDLIVGTVEDNPETYYKRWASDYLSTEEEDKWLFQCFSFPTLSDQTYGLYFTANKGPLSASSVAIDNITVSEGSCAGSLLDGLCTFKQLSPCGVTVHCDQCLRSHLEYTWRWMNETMKADSIFGENSDEAIMSFSIPANDSREALRFTYMAYGDDEGSFTVRLYEPVAGYEILVDRINGGSKGWKRACVEYVFASTLETTLEFKATRGKGNNWIIAIDNVELSNEPCPVSSVLCDEDMDNCGWALDGFDNGLHWTLKDESASSVVDIRLIGGSTAYNGKVEILHNGRWGSVCDDSFDVRDAQVFCRMLNFNTEGAKSYLNSYFGPGTTSYFWLDDLRCSGQERHVEDCPRSAWGSHNCGSSEFAGIACDGPGAVAYGTEVKTFVLRDSAFSSYTRDFATISIEILHSGGEYSFVFDYSNKQNYLLKIWVQDEVAEDKHILETITETGISHFCGNLPDLPGLISLGITAVKLSSYPPSTQIWNFDLLEGNCKKNLAQHNCTFETHYRLCGMEIVPRTTTCAPQYRWERVTMEDMVSAGFLDVRNRSTFFRPRDHVMYVNKDNGDIDDVAEMRMQPLTAGDAEGFCSLKFVYHVENDTSKTAGLRVKVNNRTIHLHGYPFEYGFMKQGCVNLTNAGCIASPGEQQIVFIASNVHAAVDNVSLSKSACLPPGDGNCQFVHQNHCGYYLGGIWNTSGDMLTTRTRSYLLSQELMFTTENICCTVNVSSTYRFIVTISLLNDTIQTHLYTSDSSETASRNISTSFAVNANELYFLLVEVESFGYYFSNNNVTMHGIQISNGICASQGSSCSATELTCDTDRCIPPGNICDGIIHCEDRTDETNCAVCDERTFNCSDRCIHADLMCDGVHDCQNDEDEILCSVPRGCNFTSQYVCGYELTDAVWIPNFNMGGYMRPGIVMSGISTIETRRMVFKTESCITAEMSSYDFSQCIRRIIKNERDSYSLLGFPSNSSEFISLPIGTYSIILEVQPRLYTSSACTVFVSKMVIYSSSCHAIRTTSNPFVSPNTTRMLFTRTTETPGPESESEYPGPETEPEYPGPESEPEYPGPESEPEYPGPEPESEGPGSTPLPERSHEATTTTSNTSSSRVTNNSTTKFSSTIISTTLLPTSTPANMPTVTIEPLPEVALFSDVQITAIIRNPGNLQIFVYWYQGTKLIARNSDIMDDNESQKYLVTITKLPTNERTVPTSDFLYSLVIRNIKDSDTYESYFCFIDVVDFPNVSWPFDVINIMLRADENCTISEADMCFQYGYTYVTTPSVSGVNIIDDGYRRLTEFDQFFSKTNNQCYKSLEELACGLHISKCNAGRIVQPVCRNDCEQIAKICSSNILNYYYGIPSTKIISTILHYCKFLPYRSEERKCIDVTLGCGVVVKLSESLRSATITSKGFPQLDVDSNCTYNIEARRFYVLKLVTHNLTLSGNCTTNYLKVGNETVCDNTIGNRTLNTANTTISIVNTGSRPAGGFNVTIIEVLGKDICGIFVSEFRNKSFEVIEEHENCTTWIIHGYDLARPGFSFGMHLNITSVQGGCVEVYHNDTIVTPVCRQGQLNTGIKATLKANSSTLFRVTFIFSNPIELGRIYVNEVRLVEGNVNNGIVRVHASDGRVGYICSNYVYSGVKDLICRELGYRQASSYGVSSDNRLHPSVFCGINAASIQQCIVGWSNQCSRVLMLSCGGRPEVSCDGSRYGFCQYEYDSRIFSYSTGVGLQSRLGNMKGNVTTTQFMYYQGASFSFRFSFRYASGGSITVYLLTHIGEEEIWQSPSYQMNGEFTACTMMPNRYIANEVRVRFVITTGVSLYGDSPLFALMWTKHNTSSCPEPFPMSKCSFDDVGVCDRILQGLPCSSDEHTVWSIIGNSLVASSAFANDGTTYVYDIEMPIATASEYQYIHMNFILSALRNLSEENTDLVFSVKFVVNGQETLLLTTSRTSAFFKKACFKIPSEAFTTAYKLRLSFTKGLRDFVDVVIRQFAAVSECEHVASCDFENGDCGYHIARPSSVFWVRTAMIRSCSVNITNIISNPNKTGTGMLFNGMNRYTPAGIESNFTLPTITIDGEYGCMIFSYQFDCIAMIPPVLYVRANYSKTIDGMRYNSTFSYKFEHENSSSFMMANIPILDKFESVSFTFVGQKRSIGLDSILVDDVKIEAPSKCIYGIQDMHECDFKSPSLCSYSSNCTVGSGYHWGRRLSVVRNQIDYHMFVDNSLGDEGHESHLSFNVHRGDGNRLSGSSFRFQYRLADATVGQLAVYYFDNTTNTQSTPRFVNRYSSYWILSDCYQLPDNFSGIISLFARRGSNRKGEISVDNVKIVKGRCTGPKINCTFSDTDDCGYTWEGIWSVSDGAIKTAMPGRLDLPLETVNRNNTYCIGFNYSLPDLSEDAYLKVEVNNSVSVDIYNFSRNSNPYGQIEISEDTERFSFVVSSHHHVEITDVHAKAGRCKPLECDMKNTFHCNEKCLSPDAVCDMVIDCNPPIDEEDCENTMACQFDNTSCGYSDDPYSSATSTLTNNIEVEGSDLQAYAGGMLAIKFDRLTLYPATVFSPPTTVENSSCVMFKYAGNAALEVRLEAVHPSSYIETYPKRWKDYSVGIESLAWKDGAITVGIGSFRIAFETSADHLNNTYLVRDAVTAIDDVTLLPGVCADVAPDDCSDESYLRCEDKSKCYPNSKQCDGEMDCLDESDEEDCGIETCTFENGDICGYNSYNTWNLTSGGRFAIPSVDHTTGTFTGHFMAIQGGVRGSTSTQASLVSPKYRIPSDGCITFYYHMNATNIQPNVMSAQILVYASYMNDDGIVDRNLLWYDNVRRHFSNWAVGAIPVQGGQSLRIEFVAKLFMPMSYWPPSVAVDDITYTEGDCPVSQVCGEDTFVCESGTTCIPLYQVCDGNADCPDESDERSCNRPDGKIILIGSDESYGDMTYFYNGSWRSVCGETYRELDVIAAYTCNKLGFSGNSGYYLYRATPSSNFRSISLRCSAGNCYPTVDDYCYNYLGIKCSNGVCFSGKSPCPGNYNKCIPTHTLCDGLTDCPDNSDETECYCAMNDTHCRRSPNYCESNTCETCQTRGMFECMDHKCLPMSVRCNGIPDCIGGNDELNCVFISTTGVQLTTAAFDIEGATVCVDDIGRFIGEQLCILAGKGLLSRDFPIDYGHTKVEGITLGSTDVADNTESFHNMTVLKSGQQCFPLILKCALPECGTTMHMQTQAVERVNFGNEAVLGKWPWQGALFRDGSFVCGCTYIGGSWALTAAHCVERWYSDYSVTFGTLSRTLYASGPAQTFRVRRVYRRDYIDVLQGNDAALLELEREPLIDNYTRPICLADESDFDELEAKDGTEICFISGFGRTENYTATGYSDTSRLRDTRVFLVDQRICNRTYTNGSYELTADGVCLQNKNRFSPACYGDSGGPLVCKNNAGQWMQYGIASYGFPGCADDVPIVYSGVHFHLGWVKSITELRLGSSDEGDIP